MIYCFFKATVSAILLYLKVEYKLNHNINFGVFIKSDFTMVSLLLLN